MKKILFLLLAWLATFGAQAQRCAVLEFSTGGSVTQEDVDGIFYIFNSNFYPSGYQMLERTQINRAIRDAGYSRTDMTLRQRLAVGRALTASIIVVGDVNLFMDEYNIDVRVISVETGATIASNPVSFKRADYRDNVKSLAQSLASKIRGGGSSSSSGGSNAGQSVPRGYVDLGLPSGTLWKALNESGYFTYDRAVQQFGSKLPSQSHWEELKDYCTWTWTGSGYKVVGPNGSSISLPASGFRNCYGSVNNVGSYGYYWSSTPDGSEDAWELYFDSSKVGMNATNRCDGQSVRLIQD